MKRSFFSWVLVLGMTALAWAEEPAAFVESPAGKPPAGAVVLLGNDGTNRFLSKYGEPCDWPYEDGMLTSTRGDVRSRHIVSKYHFRDAQLHVEFMLPESSGPKKFTGNSGVYLHGHYELQIFDSFGKEDLDQGDCGAIYGFAPPLTNACRKPGQWQCYDIIFRAPRRDKTGRIVEPGSITAKLNGQLVQRDTRFEEPRSVYHPLRYKTTPYTEKIRDKLALTGVGPVFLQDHDNPVRFRNIWVMPLDDKAGMFEAGVANAEAAAKKPKGAK